MRIILFSSFGRVSRTSNTFSDKSDNSKLRTEDLRLSTNIIIIYFRTPCVILLSNDTRFFFLQSKLICFFFFNKLIIIIIRVCKLCNLRILFEISIIFSVRIHLFPHILSYNISGEKYCTLHVRIRKRFQVFIRPVFV